MSKMGLDTGECTAYNFKLALEEREPKSKQKSVSTFASSLGGSFFFGIDDEGIVRGLDDVQHMCETISSKIRGYMDSLPEVEMIHRATDKGDILQLKVDSGSYTPYYYVGDGQRVAFVRVGDESLPATAEQIQDLDIEDISSERRNPILANVMAQLNYMEKRGCGLTRIYNDTKSLEGYRDELMPMFKSTLMQFQTIIFASADIPIVGDAVGEPTYC